MKQDVTDRIKNFNADRELAVLPIKYKAMAQSPFSFFRGTCHIFYEDLLKNYPFAGSPVTWICGDLHIENFGSYKGENRLLYFDMNDFDESLQAPLLYEIARLIVSVMIKTGEIKFSSKERKKIVQQLLQQYKTSLIKNKAQDIEKETATGLIKKLIDIVDERKSGSLLIARTNNKSSKAKLLINNRLLPIEETLKKNLLAALTPWFSTNHFKGYKVVDAGFRIAGTGSIGVKRYLCLLENETNSKQKKLIDVKQALPSSIHFTKKPIVQPNWINEADRIVKTQEMMQHVSPAFLSTFNFEKNSFVVKEIQPTSDKICIEKNMQKNLLVEKFVIDLAKITASAQLRSSGRLNAATADELKAFGEEDSWVKPLIDWCEQYTEQVKKDYTIYYKAWKEGFFTSKK